MRCKFGPKPAAIRDGRHDGKQDQMKCDTLVAKLCARMSPWHSVAGLERNDGSVGAPHDRVARPIPKPFRVLVCALTTLLKNATGGPESRPTGAYS